MKNNNFRLKGFEFSEWIKGHKNWDIKELTFGDLNVLFSDNAQGKTRLFNVLRFLKGIHTGDRLFNNPNYKCKTKLRFEDGKDKIYYNADMTG